MPQPLLSLVLPVYNVADYLPRCLDSLLAQTVPVDQIVIVDDGSSDDSPEILWHYAERCDRIEVVRQTNAGVSVARNVGLAHARGQYVAFVDPDDFVAPDLFENLLSMAQGLDLDIALGNGNYHFEGRQADYPIYRDELVTGVTSGETWLEQALRKKVLLHMVWLHLYKRDFLQRHGFAFAPGIAHEDVVWTTQVLMAAQRVRYDPTPRYFYRQRLRPLPPAENDRRLEYVITGTLFNARALADMVRQAKSADLSAGLRWQLVDGALSVFHKIEKLSDSERRAGYYRQLRDTGFFALLWRHAQSFAQTRKIIRHYLKSLILAR